MANGGAWAGAERATGTALNTAFNFAQLQATARHQRALESGSALRLALEGDRLKIAQDVDVRHAEQAGREKQVFEYAEKKRVEQEKQDDAYVPASTFYPDIVNDKNTKKLFVEAGRSAGYDIKETADGEVHAPLKAYKYAKKLLDTDAEFRIAILQSKGLDVKEKLSGLERQSVQLSQEIMAARESGKDQQKIAEMEAKQKQIKLAMSGIINSGADIQKVEEAEQRKFTQAKELKQMEVDASKGREGLTYHIEKEQIGGQKVQDYRVFVDKQGNVTKREAVGKPYTNTEGVANVRVQAFGTVPNAATGTYFDKITKKYYMNIAQEDGTTKKMELNSEQVKNLGLQVKEESTASDIKSMQQSAPAVLDFTKKLKKEIADAENGLGPAASRWKEFKQGKVGLSDPAFTEIKTNTELLVTRLMKMHVGARGSEYIMKEFKKMVEVGKTSPENLKAALKQIEDYANEAGKGRIPKLYESLAGGAERPDPLGIR